MAGFMGLIFAVIIGIGVAVPVSSQVISAASLTGIDATIAGFVTTLLIVSVLALVARAGGIA